MRAHVLIREQPWYRRDAFIAGLRASGHEVLTQQPQRLDKSTCLVIWNRYAGNHELALQVECSGGIVLVAENGYLGHGGTSPKFDVHPGGPQPHHHYAVSRGFHNDETRVVQQNFCRFPALEVELLPWRTEGEYVLVCPNRSFGVPGRAMPPDWATQCATRLRKQTKLPVRIRSHPGNDEPKSRPLAEDLRGARAVAVWTSSCGVHALVQGIPTFCDAPYWIMKSAAATGPVEQPVLLERAPAFERMAWGQWTLAEIQSGELFKHLLPVA